MHKSIDFEKSQSACKKKKKKFIYVSVNVVLAVSLLNPPLPPFDLLILWISLLGRWFSISAVIRIWG